MILISGTRIDLILVLLVIFIVGQLCYNLALFRLSFKEPSTRPRARHALSPSGAPGSLHSPHIRPIDSATFTPLVIFLIPCLNEGRVIANSLKQLQSMPYEHIEVLVIDDASDDDTASIVQSFSDPRIHLLQRKLPAARVGKGAALNAAVAHVRQHVAARSLRSDEVIICVLDADGRLDNEALVQVLPLFAQPRMGAVQTGVRINNRSSNLLARMQDIEFVLYTQVFQRGRRHFGSVGLGGNGQFVRLSALKTLGVKPWSDSLTEDLDLGVRLNLAGWELEFCSQVSVHQQGLTSLRRWVKQRTRWFQGHLQSWSLVPKVLTHLRGSQRADLLYHLTSPFLLLISSLISAGFAMWIVALGVMAFSGKVTFSWWYVTTYLLVFSPAFLYARLYQRQEKADNEQLSFRSAVLLLHVYVFYSGLWFVSAWRATVRACFGRTGWAKTDRLIEST